MNRLSCLVTLMVFTAGLSRTAAEVNRLTPEETKAGWRLLFDGKTTKGWRTFKKQTFPTQGWVVEDGWLKKTAKITGGDIITDDEFSDFELEWEWRLAPKANSGLKYMITEKRDAAIGHEYQLMDDMEGANDKNSTASYYNVLAPTSVKPMKAAGEVNHSRIVVRGNHVEHWLNGARVLTYDLGSDAVKSAVAKSKFKDVEGFGTKIKGHILLTDHKDEAWFRNIKIRLLDQ